jgi:uncharacterized protein (TIGR00369 family)
MPRPEDFAPLPADKAAYWANFPHWSNDPTHTNYAIHLGMIVEELRQDYARMRLPFRAEVLQPAGIMHGGAIASLIDTVVVPVVGWNNDGLQAGQLLTISMNVNYVGSIKDEDAIAEGFVERRGRSIVFVRAEVKGAVSGRLCATASLVYKN